MNRKIIFLAGIHGVGKGTLAKEIAKTFNLQALSASEVLKWDEIRASDNKRVSNFSSNQERLISNLKSITKPDQYYLLDGHFVLLNSEGTPEKVDESTFIEIQPTSIILLTCDSKVVAERLRKRDGISYNISTLEKMQELEIEHSSNIAKKLNIPFLQVEPDGLDEVQNFIKKNESIN